MKNYLLPMLLMVALIGGRAPVGWAQTTFKILHFTKTSGWDHKTRDNSLQMFRAMGEANNFTVENDPDGSEFNSVENLRQYAVVVFSNTSGNNILSASQRANFEQYINGGGSILGIHAATDTYRHSTANGGSKGTWNWYAELIGASVQENPNHVEGTPRFSMAKVGTHPSLANLPSPWAKEEEYYYWLNGYYNQANVPVLEVEQTRHNPNTAPADYDRPRPMSWYRQLQAGGRVFYTALGHRPSDFASDENFRNHIRDALLWITESTLTAATAESHPQHHLQVQNPVRSFLRFTYAGSGTGPLQIAIVSGTGQQVYTQVLPTSAPRVSDGIDLSGVAPGIYFFRLTTPDHILTRKVLLTR